MFSTDVGYGPATIVAAIIVAIPAAISAITSIRTHRNVETKLAVTNGKEVGKLVEDLRDEQLAISGQIVSLTQNHYDHVQDDLNFQEKTAEFQETATNFMSAHPAPTDLD